MGQSLSSWASNLAHSHAHKDEPVGHSTLLLDAQNRIVALSAGVCQMLRVTIHDLLGRHIGEFLPLLSDPSHSPASGYPFGKRVCTHLSRELTVMRREDGSEIPVTVSVFETKEDGHLLLWLRHLHSEIGHFPLIPVEEAQP